MVFSSHIFLLWFLPAFLLAYFLVPARWRNGVLLAGSVAFYAWGAPRFVLVLLGATAATFYLVRGMGGASSPRVRRLLCAVAVGVNLGLLAYFKYANFFVDNLNALLSHLGLGTMGWERVLLPIGISFFSFQSVTYVIDVYRGVCQPMRRLRDYMVYIIMFPQLVAGPIVRYTEIADQVTALRRLRWEECMQGFYRFVIGLSKKVLIADVIGRTVDAALGGDIAAMGQGTAWVTILAYTMQLYFDFSGYSDMAIGLGRILGFRFPENFDNPYTSASITEFWRRWHITLGTFMRNYLYIPLGGNRKGRGRTYLNLWVVFLLSGLWHGASWNFVIWGAYHGFFLVAERMANGRKANRSNRANGANVGWSRVSHFVRVLLTFVVVMVGWAIFRIEDLPTCWLFITRLFAFGSAGSAYAFGAEFFVTLAVAVFFAFFTLLPLGKRVERWTFYTNYEGRTHILVWLAACLLMCCCVASLTATDFSPFIYFRF